MDSIAFFNTFLLWLVLNYFLIRLVLKNRNNLNRMFLNKKYCIRLLIATIILPFISFLSFKVCNHLFMNTCHGHESWSAFERSVSQNYAVIAGILWFIIFCLFLIIFLIGLIKPSLVKYEKRINIFTTSFVILFYSGFMVIVFLMTTGFALSGHVYTNC